MIESSNGLAIYASRRKLLFLAGVWLVFLAITIGFVITPIGRNRPGLPLVSFAVVMFAFVYGFAFAARQLADRKPLIRVDQEGIQTTIYSRHGLLLTWDEIAQIAVYDRPIGALGWPVYHYVCIVPKVPESVLEHTSTHALVRTFYRWILTHSVFPWEVAVAIPQHLLPMSARMLAKQIAASYREQITAHGVAILA